LLLIVLIVPSCLHRGRVSGVKWPNQQCRSTEAYTFHRRRRHAVRGVPETSLVCRPSPFSVKFRPTIVCCDAAQTKQVHKIIRLENLTYWHIGSHRRCMVITYCGTANNHSFCPQGGAYWRNMSTGFVTFSVVIALPQFPQVFPFSDRRCCLHCIYSHQIIRVTRGMVRRP